MPVTKLPKNTLVEAIRGTAQRMQQPTDDNVLKAQLLGFLGNILENQLPTEAEQILPMPAATVVAPRLPRIANPIEALAASGLTPGRGSLAKTLKTTSEPSIYGLHDQTADRLYQIYNVGRDLPTASNWGGVTDELLAAFGGDQEKALQWSRLWGATSPNTSVPVNTRESISALNYAYNNPGKLMTVPTAQTLESKITMAPSKVPNINRALAGEPLSGDKVEAMSGFMVGKPRIPIDVHTLYAVGSDADKLGPELSGLRTAMTKAEKLPPRGSLTDTDIYLRYERALSDTLKQFNPGRSGNEVFATTWEGARHTKGLKPQGGPIDILRKKGLLEVGAMLDPDRLRAVLKTSGWTAGAIGALIASLGDDAGSDQTRR
mgnify:CR=1 FL=1